VSRPAFVVYQKMQGGCKHAEGKERQCGQKQQKVKLEARTWALKVNSEQSS
jgi:hypothetical protein